ncbi:hypothetical protein [Paeniglutamicibacter sp. NPDC091659]|uniref:hypothetical protein n=1 Tax=Paeniglutamicibacter sp. NPDC091659 TaxID=3364389 RepID=UPI0038136CB0
MATLIAGLISTGIGIWMGFILLAFGVAPETAVGAAAILGLLGGFGTGSLWPEIRASLVETRSWWFYSGRGVAPRSFLVGRLLVGRSARMVIAGFGILSALFVLKLFSPEHSDLSIGWAVAVIAGPGAAACGVAYSNLRLTHASQNGRPWTVVFTVIGLATFVGCSAAWTTSWVNSCVAGFRNGDGVSAGFFPSASLTAALCVSSVVCIVVAVGSYKNCGTLTWAIVTKRAETIGDRTQGRMSRVYGGRVVTELILLDVRRSLRSFEWRMRPGLYMILSMALSVTMLGALGRWFFVDSIEELTAGPVAATVVGGVCAGYSFVLLTSLYPLISLDSDRHGTTLMRTFPHGIRSLAAARSATGALIVAGTGALFIGLLCIFVPIGPRAIGTAASACAAVAIVAPTLGCFVSMRYPQPDWKEASEISQRGWARMAVTYGVGISIAVAISTASGAQWSGFFAGATVLSSVLVAPLIAAGITAALPSTIGVKHRAQD